MNITSVLVSAPVTALDVEGHNVLSGETSCLHIYNLTSGDRLHQECVLGPHVIHGIRKGKDGLCAVYGQKAVCVLHVELEEIIRLVKVCDTTEFKDWILDVAFLRHEASPSASCLGLVFAHNSVMLWDWKLKDSLQHVHCAENCILYSAKLLGNTWEGVTVSAGTVFNQVVLWTPREGKDVLGRVEVLRRLSGHQGVIFNMSYHKKRKLLCSVSDDRSIRLWHLDLENTPREQSDEAQMVLYGHSARVWDAKILDDTIVSIGEDAVCCVWNSDGEIIHKFTGHKGKSIWSLAVHANQKHIVTGGGDGSIRVWSIAAKQEQRIRTEELHLETEAGHLLRDDLSMSSHCSTEDEKVDVGGLVPRQLAVLNTGKIVIMTQNGCLVCYLLQSKEWRLLSRDENYQSYSLLCVCPSHHIVALGNIHGSVKILALDTGKTLDEVSVFSGKVFSLCWMNDDDLFVSGPEGLLIWWQLRRSSDRIKLDKQGSFKLPEAPQRWATSIALISHPEEALVCGDRRGSLLLYSQLHQARELNGEPAHPTHCLPGIHGKVGVTHVCHHAGYVYSAGRDGTYRQYRLQGTRLHMMNTFKVYKGFDWIAKISFTAADNVLVSGFHASSFIIWSTHSNEKLVEIQCGGGHRAWGFASCQVPMVPGSSSPTLGEEVTQMGGTGSALAVFACIKAKKIVVCTAPAEKLQQHPILKDGLHGRKVSCIKHLATVPVHGGECALVASGSEDNSVNISAITFPPSNPAVIHVLHRLNVHISSVRCLATCPSSYSNNLMDRGEVTGGQETGQRLLLFSVGGRRAIQCWRVKIPTECPIQDEVHKWLKSSCTVEHLASYGNTDNVKQRRWLKKHGHPVDSETRFMSVCVWNARDLRDSMTEGIETLCLLGVGGSDSITRIFSFNEESKALLPLLSTDWHDCCLLTSLSVVHQTPWGPTPILLTAGTNGKIALWDIQKAIRECGTEVEQELEHDEMCTDRDCSITKLQTDSDACHSSLQPCSNLGDTLVSSQANSNTRQPSPCQEKDSNSEMINGPHSNCDRHEKALPFSREKLLVVSPTPRATVNQEESDALWDADEDIGRLLLSVKAHQSGVNALYLSQIDGSRYLLGSGGDDNSIHLALLTVSLREADQQIAFRLESSHSIPQAHAAQVTGLCFVDPFTFVSTSIDQRIIVWKIDLTAVETPTFKVQQMCSMFMLIADCADGTFWKSRDGGRCIALCGQGVQVLRLDDQ